MNIKYVCAGLAFMALPIFTSAQSDPTPFNLGISGNYAFTNWPAISPGGTYPSGMIFHQMDAALPSLTSTAASDLGAGFSYLNLTGTRIQGVGSRGIELQNTQSPLNTGFLKNRLGEIVLGVVTTGRTQLQLSWKAQTRTNGGNITAIRCQYRIGTSGSYSDFPAVSEYMSSNIPLDSAVKTFSLPPACEDQALVQIRWFYYTVSGNNPSSRTLRLDDIFFTSVPIVTSTIINGVCYNDTSYPLTAGSPAGGIYSGTGITNGTTINGAVAGIGSHPYTYTYTDINGISNSTTGTVNIIWCPPLVRLTSAYCGATGLLKHSYIYCTTAPGIQDFEYEFSGGDLSVPFYRTRGNWFTDFNLSWVPQLNYGQTYNVRVRSRANNMWGNYGAMCTITLVMVPPTPHLVANSCGATGLNLASYIYTTAIANASDYTYKFEIPSTGFSVTRNRGSNFTDFNLKWVTGLQYGNTYHVSVRAKTNGIWGAWGEVCQITLQPFPLTSLDANSCGASGLLLTDRIYCVPVPAATNYQYKFTPAAGGTAIYRYRAAPWNDLVLAWVTGIQTGATYYVEVRAYAGAQWGPFGDVCMISISSSSRYAEVENAAMHQSNLAVTVFPNPVPAGSIPDLVISGADGETAIVTIFELAGKHCFTTKMDVTGEAFTATFSGFQELAQGVYLIQLTIGEEMLYLKCVIE